MKNTFKKFGIASVCALTLVGAGYSVSTPFSQVVYAETHTNTFNETIVIIVSYYGDRLDGTSEKLQPDEWVEVKPGEELPPAKDFDGYVLTETFYSPPSFHPGAPAYNEGRCIIFTPR
ncbi:hypothetical protein [Streptococcus merionis]|uniref:hypothetical protein n=1 Tax=Streptococcus merionis TaxID=400065 RepID=UPI003517730B